jgi:hypothetical protein
MLGGEAITRCNRFAFAFLPCQILARNSHFRFELAFFRLVGTIMLFFPFQDVFLFDKNPMGVTN